MVADAPIPPNEEGVLVTDEHGDRKRGDQRYEPLGRREDLLSDGLTKTHILALS